MLRRLKKRRVEDRVSKCLPTQARHPLSRIEAELERRGLALPDSFTPRGAFLPYRKEGNLVFMAGQICEWNGDVPYAGPVLDVGQKAQPDE